MKTAKSFLMAVLVASMISMLATHALAEVLSSAPKDETKQIGHDNIQDVDVSKAMEDRWLGDKDAPITIIEYASLTCDHCAAFANKVLPEVKKSLIDTGRAKLILRDMPWDKFALKAAMMARCAPREKYYEIVETIFATQANWARSDDPQAGLIDIGKAFGMDAKFIQSCMDNENLEKALLTNQLQAQKEHGVKATPTFLFFENQVKIDSFPEFDELLKKLGGHH
ncbi:MAG: thioredoxin domain-containing protein [bacterium]|nr:thioredoxin domain-containing protein [bacterium]